MTNRIAVGTPVNVSDKYGEHKGCNDLVVLSDRGTGYGIGPKGNNPDKGHHGPEGWLYYSNNEVTPKEESKTVTEFKVGDKVEVFQNGYTVKAWVGVQGIVKEARRCSGYSVELTDPAKTGEKVGYVAYLTGGNLKLVEAPKTFTFKDIQKGDTIRRTATYKGATEVREGVVATEGSYYWATEQGNYILAYDTDGTTAITDVTLELVNRPKPEPTLLENTKKGDKLVIEFKDGLTKVYTKGKAGSWSTLVLTGNGQAHNGFTWSSEALEREVVRAAVKGHTLITA